MAFPNYCVTKNEVDKACIFMEGAKAELDAVDMYETMKLLLNCPVDNKDTCEVIEHILQEELEHHAEFLGLLSKIGKENYLDILNGKKEAPH